MNDSLSATSSAGRTPSRSRSRRSSRRSSHRSSRSGNSSAASEVSELDDNVAETRQITAEDFCRVLYVKSGDPTEYICGNVARCRRAGHREARSIPERVGLPGIYDVTLSDRGKVLGIVAATRQNAAAFAIRQEEQRARNRLLTETIARLNQPEPLPVPVLPVPPILPVPATAPVLVPAAVQPAPQFGAPAPPVPVPAFRAPAPVPVPVPIPVVPVPVPAPLPVPVRVPVAPVPVTVPVLMPVPVTVPVPAASNDTRELLARLMEAVTSLSADVQATRQEQEVLRVQHEAAIAKNVPVERPHTVPNHLHPSILRTGGVAANAHVPAPNGVGTVLPDELLLQQLASRPPNVPAVAPLNIPARSQTRPVFLGKDVSTGDKSSAYGCKLSDGLKLARTLAPEGLSQEGATRFCEGLSDIVAYPKGEGTSENNEGNVLLQVMSSLVDSRNQGSGGQVDASFKNANRNVLGRITNMDKLRDLVETFTDEGEDLLVAMAGRWCNTLTSLLHLEDDEAEMMVQLSPLFRVGARTVELYLLLLNHLLSLCYQEGSASGFEHCKDSLQYHAGKLGKIRDTYNIRIQVLVGIYCYLRDGLASNFRPPKLMARQLDNLRRKMESSSHSTTTTSGCKHCGTALHSTSVACPWRSKATTNAKKLAAKALLTLSTGASAAVGAAAGAAAGAAEGAGTDS